MYVVKEKNYTALKVVLAVLAVLLVVGAGVAVFLIWKKKRDENKKIEDEIDAAIDAAFAEDDCTEVAIVED